MRVLTALAAIALPMLACECRRLSVCELIQMPTVFIGEVIDGGVTSIRDDPWHSNVSTEKTMTRSEQVRMFVLDTIADDYEEVEHIGERIAAWSAVCGLTIRRDEIVQALISLTQEGFARAYHLMETPGNRPEEIETILSPDQIRLRDPYFLITEKGVREINRPDEGWPFDREGLLRKDWVHPTD